MKKELIPDEALDRLAHRFKVLGEPHRLLILHRLYLDGEQSVQALAKATGLHQPNLSKHLQALAAAGLVRRRRAGTHVFYRLDAPELPGLCLLALSAMPAGPSPS